MKTVRLMGHAGSDIELSYLDESQIESAEKKDPLLLSALSLIDNRLLSTDEVVNLYEHARKRINFIFDQATTKPRLSKASDVMSYIIPEKIRKNHPKFQAEKDREKLFGREYNRLCIWPN